jgi:hypothetical protein
MIVFAILFKQAMRQIDFVMAFPQAPIEMDMYMELPQGIQTKHGNVCYHHFWEHVRSREIEIYPVSTHDQVAGTLTMHSRRMPSRNIAVPCAASNPSYTVRECAIMNNTVLLTLLKEKWTIPLLLEM